MKHQEGSAHLVDINKSHISALHSQLSKLIPLVEVTKMHFECFAMAKSPQKSQEIHFWQFDSLQHQEISAHLVNINKRAISALHSQLSKLIPLAEMLKTTSKTFHNGKVIEKSE